LRQVLGYESWNLFGISYGTRLALTIMRDFGHTGAIRSVVLDSVYPPQVNDYTDMTANSEQALRLLFARCVSYEPCSRAYPNLEARFYQLVDRFNANPVTITVSDRVNLTVYQIPFTGDDLLKAVLEMMYDENSIKYIPQMISQLEGEFGYSSLLTEHLTTNLTMQANFSEGMELSVQCIEEAPFTTVAEFREKTAALTPLLVQFHETFMEATLAACAVWDVAPAAPLENEPVHSDIPTLILAGDYDPVTPPGYARDTAVYLPNAYYFEFAGIGHGVANSTSCGVEMTVAFLDEPTMPPDDACLEHMYFGFVVP
jgi:pimeloyl-ACP methyl ester carboxylesterase